MAICGTVLLSFCLVCSLIVGKLIGLAIGIDANVGGVGIAMLMLILISGRLQQTGRLPAPTRNGEVESCLDRRVVTEVSC